jgi:cob(I)alamin adenosyltransferase
MVKVYTRRGDAGETGLLFGGRVPKDDPRCEAYGTVDTAVSAMGLARALCQNAWVKEVLLDVQREMFIVGSELATDTADYGRLRTTFSVVTADMVSRLEGLIDEVDAQIELPSAFIVPGGSAGSGALDLARTLVRESERRVVALQGQPTAPKPEVLRYLNRLSDLLFMLARFEDKELPVELSSSQQQAL